MIKKDELLKTGDQQRIWQKYCGFLDLSLQEFMEIQEHLLMEQIELVYDSTLAKKFMPKKPKNISEFRQLVPLTTYEDYADYLNNKNEDALAVKPYSWAHTSGIGGTPKWVPYTERALEKLAMYGVSAVILSCTDRKGVVNVKPGIRILQNVPPAPYMSGILAQVLAQQLDARVIPPLDQYQNADFETRIQAGFQIALRTGVDFLASLTSIQIKMGERFTESSGQMKLNRHMLHPQIVLRLIRAWLQSKREGRALLPKDLWPLKGMLCFGMDTGIYRERLRYYWGREALESYGGTESGVIALSAWNKGNMTFVPSSCFLEFVPEVEWIRSRADKGYQPSTLLLDEVKTGECYEVIITSFNGMPFLRYKVGDLIKIVGLADEDAGIKLPQMAFHSRSDGLIDIAGFPRLDEKTIWQAIINTKIKYEDWSARKEYEQNDSILRLYIELKEEIEATELEKLIHEQLVKLCSDYADLENMLGIQPLRVSPLPVGSFQEYYEERKRGGADLAHMKPPHMNASEAIIQDLLNQAQST